MAGKAGCSLLSVEIRRVASEGADSQAKEECGNEIHANVRLEAGHEGAG
jgi:hypothetical protein